MDTSIQAPSISKGTLWTARTIRTLTVLFLLFDIFGKLAKPQPVIDAFAREGIPIGLAPVIGTLLLVLVGVYVIPRTSVFGAILLTGYLGGATAVNLRDGDPVFEVIFPVIFGVLVWAPLFLCDARLRDVIPLRNEVAPK